MLQIGLKIMFQNTLSKSSWNEAAQYSNVQLVPAVLRSAWVTGATNGVAPSNSPIRLNKVSFSCIIRDKYFYVDAIRVHVKNHLFKEIKNG
jgi:hypothetical protein